MFAMKSVIFITALLSSLIGANVIKPRRDEEVCLGSHHPFKFPPPAFLHVLQIIHDVCVEKTGVDEKIIKEFSDGAILNDEALKCYMNCLFHEVNIVDDNGEMHYDKLKRLIPDFVTDYVGHLIEGCESHIPIGATQCERAWSWHVCWKEFDPTHYFLV